MTGADDVLTGDYVLDPTHSRIGFSARHAMVTRVRGHFDRFHGRAHIDVTDMARCHALVKIEAASINTGDAQRDAHLRSRDFLDVESHPHLLFTSTRVDRVDDQIFRITGELDIRGVSRSLGVDFEFLGTVQNPTGTTRGGFEGGAVISRNDWGLTWNSPLAAGGVLVSDAVTLDLDVSAVREADAPLDVPLHLTGRSVD